MAKRKFTAKQLAAQKLFAKRAKAGAFKKKSAKRRTRKTAAKRNPRAKHIEPVKGEIFTEWETITDAAGREYFIRKWVKRFGRKPTAPWELLPEDGSFNKHFKTKREAVAFVKTGRDERRYGKGAKKNPLPAGFGFRTGRVSVKARAKMAGEVEETAAERRARIMGRGPAAMEAKKKFAERRKRTIARSSPSTGSTARATGRATVTATRARKATPARKATARKAPARTAAKSPYGKAVGFGAGVKRNPKKKAKNSQFVIKGIRPSKTGYTYYYLTARGRFDTNIAKAKKYNTRPACHLKMREIAPKLPLAISSIRCEKI